MREPGRALHRRLGWLWLCVLVASSVLATPRRPSDLPLDDRLTYDISWLGVHCGEMTLESAPVAGKPALVKILMTVKSSEFFDAIYKVRAELESIYHQRRESTRRYHERSSEQDKSKDDLWVVHLASRRARRTLNGEVESFDLPEVGVHDPLALLYRIRSLARQPGDEISLLAMTSEGSVEARVSVERWERFDTGTGEVTGLKVVQQAVGDAEFARGGGMTLWLASDSRRTPQRIEFKLPFGTLVAQLKTSESE